MRRYLPFVAALLGGVLLFAGGALAPWDGEALVDDGTSKEVVDAVSSVARPGAADLSVEALEAEVEGSGGSVDAWSRLGFAYIQEARNTADPANYGKAERAFERALSIDRDDFGSVMGTAVLAGSTHDFAGQVRLARRAIDINPLNAYARGVLGDGLLELGRQDEAAVAYQKMMDLRPDLAGYARVSHLFSLRGDSDRAIEAMELAAASTLSARDQAWAHAQIAEIHISSGDIEEASRSIETAHSLAPDYFLPDIGRAHVAFAQGDLPRSIELQSSVIERHPSPSMVAELGDLLWVAGRADEAEPLYERSEALLEDLLEAGVEIDVEMPVFFADSRRDPQRALEMARSIYRGRDGQPAADALAWALWATGDLDGAETHIREAIAEGPESPDVLFHAGMIAADQGRDRVAVRRLRRALAISPFWSFRDSVVAERTIERLTT